MPHVTLIDAWGSSYQIATTRDATLAAWFDEWLPLVNRDLGQTDVPPARITVMPLWPGGHDAAPDWATDSRVLGHLYPFAGRDGAAGMAALDALRASVQAEVARLRAADQDRKGTCNHGR